MESYIVRIYRRDPKNPRRVIGLVENVEGERIRAFTTHEELFEILTTKEKDTRGRRKAVE